MRLISRKQAEIYLGTRFAPFAEVHGSREVYTPTSVLAFAGTLVCNKGQGTYTILLPWQTAKQWALDRGEIPPDYKLREYAKGEEGSSEYTGRATKFGAPRGPRNGADGIPFVIRGEYVHEVAGLVNFPGEVPREEETEYSVELERDVVLRSRTMRFRERWA